MAIVIKNMAMPEICGKCSFCVCYDVHEADYHNCCATGDEIIRDLEQKEAYCPLVEIPDELVDKYQELMKNHPDTKQFALSPFQKGEDK